MHASAVLAGLLALAAIVPAREARAQGCEAGGFLLAVSAPGVPEADSAYLTQVARALAYRWPVPSRRRETYASWRRIRKRTLPPEPRWADDWHQAATLTAEMRIVLPRRGRPRADEPRVLSGDDLFDRSLRLMVTDPLPASPELPPFPPGLAADSIALVVHLGHAPDSLLTGRITFATNQRPVEVVPGSMEIIAPRTASTPPGSQRFATFKYDINDKGLLVPSTLEVLDSSDRGLVDAVRSALYGARFRPAEQGCRAVTITVVQTFRG